MGNNLGALLSVGSMAIPFWDAHSEGYEGPDLLDADQDPWGICRLAGEQLPGRADATGSAKQRIDVQKGNGKDGGVLIERGYIPGQLDIELTIWTPGQWAKWLGIEPKIFRAAGKLDVQDHKKRTTATAEQIEVTRKNALPIYHARAQMLGITSVLIEQITLPRPGPELGTQVITIKCVQYLAPTTKSAVRKAAGIQAPPQDPRQRFQPARNQPGKPSESGAGGPFAAVAAGAPI